MPDARVHRAVYEVTASAPADVLYGLIADATQWPLFFQPCIHVEQLDFDGTRERLRMWGTAGDTITSWFSTRRLDVGRQRVEFSMDLPAAPAESMSGVWTVKPLGDRSRVTLEHTFTVAGDAPGDVAWVKQVVRDNSRAQLEQLAALAARWKRLDDLVLSFEDTVRIKGPSELIFDFLYRAQDWPSELPNVHTLEVVEDQPGVQVVSMGSFSSDGSAQETKSVRICFPGAGRIVYKQTQTSPLLFAHTGEWSVEADESGVNVTARHSVLLHEDSIEQVLGEGTSREAAGQHVRDALGRAGLLVLHHAAQHAVSAVRVL
ncbi:MULTISPECIES: aromatase/cyclase [unclassified Streptomyces]|uniref:aromatase/cyclase n=1 Tax=unclassified Streptomyces TaxID=2593676 RepID=UPI001BE9FE21|nr:MULTISPECIES: aromatase/cyclase [unclassified Streptomyces]MBT2402021.1 aromatase/cyclase [Streptomyces sp. ISL-21]MBT2454268.1 aromatase/cyclase [Streptomyces sp. ISL-86]MBT2609469.1 aromatase/cyclase [Streptomyces sp. ISL-87]